MTDTIVWERDFEQARARALRERKPLLIDVMKVPCRGCAKLDTVTYVDEGVIAAVNARFVPLKLNLFEDPRDVLRPLNVIWTPTILFADRRGTVHYRNINFLPPELFLPLLDIGEANVDIHWSRVDHAIELLSASYERNSDSLLTPELLYWWGIAVYLKTHSDPEMYKVWDVLRERFPNSIWTQRVP